MNNKAILFLITLVSAFCSIVYELILAQTLAAFLDNTVLRYSITIGLYLFALGGGAFIAEGKFLQKPLLNLQIAELWLSVLGGFCVVFVFLFDHLNLPKVVFLVLTHGLIILIGILSGFELPLLINLAKRFNLSDENHIIALNYTGAFVGTVCFAFLFYPLLGLISSSMIVGLLNAIIGILLIAFNPLLPQSAKEGQSYVIIQGAVLVLLGFYLVNVESFTQFFINMYLK